MLRAVLIHLRLPFSLFLAPVYFFALSQAEHPDTTRAVVVFLLLHLLLFPASNAYNSYYDKDEHSIGLIEKPPPVTPLLLYTALGLDLLALLVAWLSGLGVYFVVYLLVYGLISKAYSHPWIRLKKRPVTSWLVVAFFQGALTYMAVFQAVTGLSLREMLHWTVLLPAGICSLNLLAVYPLTQVYQHEEDRVHGDLTYSRMVGIKGTFLSAAVFFSLSFLAFSSYFIAIGKPFSLLLLGVFTGPSLFFFLRWWKQVNKSAHHANFRNTMLMNILASAGLNLFFLVLLWCAC